MLDGLFILLGLSLVMALASFLAGVLPLSMNLSQSQLRLISTIGMGVLVGTSLIVIIPEGIEVIYAANPEGHSHGRRYVWGPEQPVEVRWAGGGLVGHAVIAHDETTRLRARAPSDTNNLHSLPAVIRADEPPPAPTPTHEFNSALEHDHEGKGTTPPNVEERNAPTFYIGLSLILGFILMFLIDKLPRYASENLQSAPPPRHISLDNLSQGLHTTSITEDEESESFLQSLAPNPRQTRSLATTTGLVIHAAADGIAMGASASTRNTKLSFIIFIAIMLHKAPAAFGLTSVLLKQGLSKRAARGHLIIFSLAAPFGALSTWLLVHLLGGGATVGGESGQWWTGMLLLFSAGTFLYVAMHAMQEERSGHEHPTTNGYVDGGLGSQRKYQRPQLRDTFAAVGGMLLPLLTQIGHHH